MNTNKTCFICNLGINSSKDEYVEIADFGLGKHIRSIFAHKICWLGHMSNKAMLMKANRGLNKVMENFGGLLN